MKRWDCRKNKEVEEKDIDKFLDDIIKVYKKHGLSISHEDYQGGFEIENISDGNIKWLKDASISNEYV